MSEDQPATPPRFTKRRIIWVCATLAAVVVMVLYAHPAYQALKSWRAHRFVAQAELFAQQQRWAEAFQKAQAAYQLSPGDARALRLVARLYTAHGYEHAITFWKILLDLPAATTQDRRDFIQFALRLGKLDQAEPTLQKLLDDEPNDFAHLILGAQFCRLNGDREMALAYCRKAVSVQPQSASARLLLVELLLLAPTLDEQDEARGSLWALAGDQESGSLDAITILSRIPNLTRAETEQIIGLLDRHPKATTEHELIQIELKTALDPSRSALLLDGLLTKFADAEPEKQLIVGRWLNRQTHFERTLALLPQAEAVKHSDLLLVRLDALAQLKRWTEIRAELELPNPLNAVLIEVFLARVAKELGESAAAGLHWRRVHLEAIERPEALLFVAHYAERIGELDDAREAYRRLTQNAAFARQAYMALIRLDEQEGNTLALRETMQRLSALYPEDPRPRNDLAYLNLLLNENIESAREIALQLFISNPNMLAYRSTLALAYLRSNDPASARALFDELPELNWRETLPSMQAVHAVVRGVNGETNLARVLALQIPSSRLKPEEKRLLKPWLTE